MRKAAFFLLVLAASLRPAGVSSAGLATTVFLSANPDAIVADGKSVATIGAEIRDYSGNTVPDGSVVSFSSSLGTIQATVTTTAGVARARLTSGTVTGTATVSAWVTQGGAVGQIKVELLAPGTEIPRQSFVTISSDAYLAYDMQRGTIDASGGARILHKGLSVTTDEAQIDVQAGTLKCRRRSGGAPVKLVRGGKSLDVDFLYYRLSDMKGNAIAESTSGKIERLAVRGADLAVQPETGEIPDSYFRFADLSGSTALIKASSITVRPRTDIQFRRAQVYVDGKRVLSMPFHVIAMGTSASSTSGSQYLGWGTNGLRIDVPLYYSLSPSSTGSFHLRRGQQAGWGFYSANAGWAFDLVQDYATAAGAQGSFALNRITGRDWGVHWNHSQELDSGSRVYSYLEFPAHRDLFGMLNLSKPLSRASLGVNLYGSKLRGQPGAASTDVYVQSLPKPVARWAANYVFLARTSYATDPGLSGSHMGAGLQMQVFGRPVSLSRRTSLATSLSFGQDWGGWRSGFTVFGNASLNHRLGQASNAGLLYSYTLDPAIPGLYGRHRLSASLVYAPSRRWQAHLFSTYTLDAQLSSTFADVSYQIRPGWRVNLLQTLQAYGNLRFSDTEVALGKAIGENEIMLVWSKSRGKLRLEFAAARF